MVVDKSNKPDTFNNETADLISEDNDSNDQAESSIQQSNDESKKTTFSEKTLETVSKIVLILFFRF